MARMRKNTYITQLFASIIALSLLLPGSAFAQEGLSLTVSPPLYQFTLSPDETWASSIKISNANSYDLDIYITPVNFTSVGEEGKGRFIPLGPEDTPTSTHSLASWIEIDEGPVKVPRGESVRVPFFVTAPEGAEPGGHYASLLIGTRPIEETNTEVGVKVSSLISALLFARVSGDIVEEGRIRQFSTKETLYEEPRAEFTLRFENIGNVHLIPRGDIIIYNMWGKERGRINVNKDANFGNVFPGSIRNFTFTWTGEDNFYDIGRYKAIATLSYGLGERQSDYKEIFFWVIPVKPLLYIGGTFLLFVFFLFYAIRRYVRHALQAQTQILVGDKKARQDKRPHKSTQNAALKQKNPRHQTKNSAPVQQKRTVQALKQPLVQGAVDLRRASGGVHQEGGERLTMKEFIRKYKKFLVFLVIFLIFFSVGVYYLNEVLDAERVYDIEVVK